MEHFGGFESKRKRRRKDGRKIYCKKWMPEEQLGWQGFKVYNKRSRPGIVQDYIKRRQEVVMKKDALGVIPPSTVHKYGKI